MRIPNRIVTVGIANSAIHPYTSQGTPTRARIRKCQHLRFTRIQRFEPDPGVGRRPAGRRPTSQQSHVRAGHGVAQQRCTSAPDTLTTSKASEDKDKGIRQSEVIRASSHTFLRVRVTSRCCNICTNTPRVLHSTSTSRIVHSVPHSLSITSTVLVVQSSR